MEKQFSIDGVQGSMEKQFSIDGVHWKGPYLKSKKSYQVLFKY